MFDDKTESAKRAIAEYEKKGMNVRLVKIASLSTRSAASAKDLVQDAFLRLLDEEDCPWKSGSFLAHMSFVMRNTWDAQMRRLKSTERPDEEVTAGDKSYAEDDPQDEEVEARRVLDVQRTLGEQLLAKVRGKHPVAARVFELTCQGIDDATEQAGIIGCPVEEVHRARDTLKRIGAQIRDEWELSEQKRMADLRRKHQEKKAEDEGEDER
jgi:DNA-directed RNA polymerase specialized sigma24 family protein